MRFLWPGRSVATQSCNRAIRWIRRHRCPTCCIRSATERGGTQQRRHHRPSAATSQLTKHGTGLLSRWRP